MELNFNLNMNNTKEVESNKRIAQADAKKKASKYEPSWEEVWITGYPTTSGKHKNGIFQTKLTDKDHERLMDVKEAIEKGEISTGVESLSKFTKTKALGLYKEVKELRRDATIQKMIEEMPSNYHCILNKNDFDDMTKLLDDEDLIGLDTETTGLDYLGWIILLVYQ